MPDGQGRTPAAGRLLPQPGLSPRRYYKLLRLARTLADMDESEKLREEHLASAFQYTRILLKD